MVSTRSRPLRAPHQALNVSSSSSKSSTVSSTVLEGGSLESGSTFHVTQHDGSCSSETAGHQVARDITQGVREEPVLLVGQDPAADDRAGRPMEPDVRADLEARLDRQAEQARPCQCRVGEDSSTRQPERPGRPHSDFSTQDDPFRLSRWTIEAASDSDLTHPVVASGERGGYRRGRPTDYGEPEA